ncbi:hypothetical protein N7474_008307 [Penicillium riverlandense]|uniref:uncharacterized protein n=1 Tax=Penicillium riverlandense TaxID=1903569 RepID=UPI0025480A9C|nr:uncharacterized protein N7474_008307 [Penicillium riverlandense]KAJ5812006.1 hypothetical protein N7474_008307 [Penicillium riverlandense]
MPAPSTGPSKGDSNNSAPTRRVVDPNSLSARRGSRPTPKPRLPTGAQDIRQTKEYKVAARRWISTIVALPIFMVTSYVLYERLYGDQSPKRLRRIEQEGEKKQQPETSSASPSSS